MGLKIRQATAAVAASSNPTLESGEQGYETDTAKMKIGDGSTAWNDLGYWEPGGDAAWGSITGTLSDQADLAAALALLAPLASPTLTGTITLAGLTGILKAAAGVVSAASAGADYCGPTTGTGVQKGDGAGGLTPAGAGDIPLAYGAGTATTSATGTLAIAHGLSWTPSFAQVWATALAASKTPCFMTTGVTGTDINVTVAQGNGSLIESASVSYQWAAYA